jgi:SAM-dependent methyltransferase
MSIETIPCIEGPGTRGDVRARTEDPLTARVRAIWSGADFLPIARSFAPGAAEFVERLALRPGESVLDAACGTGNLAIPAAWAGARVTGIDIAANLIDEARIEARAAGADIDFEVGDVEAMPYGDGEFDTTITMFGAMFAPRPERAAAELLRVTKQGGRIVMANWTPDGFIGQMLRAHTAVVPPPTGVPSPLLWGDEKTVRARFGDGAREISCVRRTLHFHFQVPPAEVVEQFATFYGPTVATLKAAGPAGGRQLRDALTRLWQEHNHATGDLTMVPAEYLEVRVLVA